MFVLFGRRCAAGLLLMLSAAAGHADGPTDSPANYAQMMPVTVSGRQAVVQLPLPRAVYFGARSSDLRDVRLFDAAGAPMPFALVERVQQEQVSRSTVPVAVFPVHARAGAPQGLPQGLQIRTRDDGTVISVTAPSAHGTAEPASELASLVLDMRPPQQAANGKGTTTVAALVLTLPPGAANYTARLAVETSDDLQRWDPLTEATVSWLVNSEGASVNRHRIEFAPRAFRYARIAWIEGKPVEFAVINADYVTRTGAPAQWDSIVVQPVPGRVDGDLAYAAPFALPVQAVGLVFQGQNVVLPATLGQYRERAGREPGSRSVVELQPVASATFYQLTQNGERRASSDVELPPTHAAQWVLRPQARVAERPALRLRWQAATMVFVAGGKPPYTLAFGRDNTRPGDLPLAQVAPGFSQRELAGLEAARTGAPVQQQVGQETAAGMSLGRTFWLWALLLCGVAALAAMAWRLTRQLKEQVREEPPEQPPA